MYREDGKLAARGRHVKHLPMGRAWEMAAKPVVFPLAQKWMGRQHEQWATDPERTKARRISRFGLTCLFLYRWRPWRLL